MAIHPHGKRVFNLTFHGLGEPGASVDAQEKRYWLAAGAFERILDHVAGRPDVRLTFDDGNLSDLTVALPALLARKMKAAFFVLAGRLGEPASLSAHDVRVLKESGMTIGLHGMAHRAWRELDARQLTVELVDARKRLEDAVGGAVDWAGCPFGAYSRRVLARLRGEGFARVYTSDRGPAHENDWLQPRNTMHATDDAAAVERICGRWWGLRHEFKLFLKRHLP